MTGELDTKQDECKFNMAFFFELQKRGKKCVIDWCIKQGLLPNRYLCPVCKTDMCLEPITGTGDGYQWSCRVTGKNSHYIRRSVRKGTWFEKSDMSLIEVLLVTYLWVKEASCDFIVHELKLSDETVSEWQGFCREVCAKVESCKLNNKVVGGPDVVVEVEETLLGKDKIGKGKWVLAGFERGTNECFFEVAEKRTVKLFLNVIEKYVLPGSTIVSCCWEAYESLNRKKFQRLKINRNLTIVDPDSSYYSKSLIQFSKNINRHLNKLGTKSIVNNFDSYISEFVWRRIHGTCYQTLFSSFLKVISTTYPPHIADETLSENINDSMSENNDYPMIEDTSVIKSEITNDSISKITNDSMSEIASAITIKSEIIEPAMNE